MIRDSEIGLIFRLYYIWKKISRTMLQHLPYYTELDSTDLATLLPYATKTNGIQSEVRPLLVLNGALDYLPPIYHPDNSDYAVRVAQEEDELEETSTDDASALIMSMKKQTIQENSGLLLYPNPTQHTLHVTYTLGLPYNAKIAIVELRGATLFEQILLEQSSDIALDVSTYTSGTYMVKLYVDRENIITKTFSVTR